ncbi:MAG: Hpt domain-containing protein [Nitrospira sp. CR1.3]|nr:Hpt domain-containing protein [Nitrospira sp. CR1.3]
MTPSSRTAEPGRVTVSVDPDLEEIVPVFLENRRREVATLRTAFAGDDLKTLRLLGHRMKGDGGGYGFDAISEIGEVLEQAAIRKDRRVIGQQIEKLDDFLTRVDVVYRK